MTGDVIECVQTAEGLSFATALHISEPMRAAIAKGNAEPLESRLEAARRELLFEAGYGAQPGGAYLLRVGEWTRDREELGFEVHRLTVTLIPVGASP